MVHEDSNPFIDFLRVWLFRAWAEITRHFMTCTGTHYGYDWVQWSEVLDEYTVQSDDKDIGDLCSYYCPFCGRKLRKPK